MNKCTVCGKECGKGKTCGSKCKQQAYRNRNTVTPPTVTNVTVEPTVTQPEAPERSLTRAELNTAIHSYPHDTWVDSPEHKELMRRLHTMSIEQLESEGYYIPCWKHKEVA